MPRNRYTIAGGIIAILFLADIINYLCSGWGLITVKVKDVPLRQVVKSIEWQGWVTIYTNIDPNTKVSMWVDHVPLAEAMDTLSANIGGPPTDGGGPGGPGGGGPGNGAGAPPAGGQPSQPNLAGGPAPSPGAPGGNDANGGRPGGRGGGGGFGGGGFGRGGAQWGLAFFVAPTSAEAKGEINSFQGGGMDDNARIFHYQTPLQILTGEDFDLPSSDPRLQTWPGMKALPTAAPVAAASNQGNAASPTTPAITPDSLQAYLQAMSQRADIWIMMPDSWNPAVSSPPAANSSISSAVKSLVGRVHGAVFQAIILRTGRGGGRRGFAGGGGDDVGWSDMSDRLRNVINGMPEETRASALSQLDQEDKFRKDVQAAPPDRQREMMRDHMMDKIADNNNWNRMSPEKRAQRFQRMVAARMAAQGK